MLFFTWWSTKPAGGGEIRKTRQGGEAKTILHALHFFIYKFITAYFIFDTLYFVKISGLKIFTIFEDCTYSTQTDE